MFIYTIWDFPDPTTNSKKRHQAQSMQHIHTHTHTRVARLLHADVYLYVDVRCAEAEAGLRSQHLLGLSDPTRHSQHQCCLIHQLVLVLLVGQDPVDCLHCVRRESEREGGGDGGRVRTTGILMRTLHECIHMNNWISSHSFILRQYFISLTEWFIQLSIKIIMLIHTKHKHGLHMQEWR